jgi:hypothetical protein
MAPSKRNQEVHSVGKNAGTSKIKKKIRDLERLLRKPDLQATKRVETERAVNALRSELESSQDAQKVRKLSKQYHMVRFFEKKKAMRHLKQSLKRCVNEGSQPDGQFKQCEIDWYYVTKFPIEKKYIALFASEERTDQHQEFLDQVTKKIASGEYPSGIQNGKAIALDN